MAEQLPAVEPPGVAIEQMLDGMQRQGTFAELAARQGTRLQEHEIEVLLGQSSKVAGLVTRARLRVACEAAERGLQEYAASDRPGAAHVGDVRGRGLAGAT